MTTAGAAILRADGCGGFAVTVERCEKFAAQQGLAVANLAHNLDKSFAAASGNQQGIQAFLIVGAGEEKAGIRGQ